MTDFAWKDWKGDVLKGAVKKAAAQGLAEAAEFLLEQANRTVPIEEATLMRSGTTSVDEGDLRAVVSYDTPYARRQHEDTRLGHDSGRRAKWLQLAMAENRERARDHIASKIKGAIK